LIGAGWAGFASWLNAAAQTRDVGSVRHFIMDGSSAAVVVVAFQEVYQRRDNGNVWGSDS